MLDELSWDKCSGINIYPYLMTASIRANLAYFFNAYLTEQGTESMNFPTRKHDSVWKDSYIFKLVGVRADTDAGFFKYSKEFTTLFQSIVNIVGSRKVARLAFLGAILMEGVSPNIFGNRTMD